jgi:GNAT superfamily N-acetyltransferase
MVLTIQQQEFGLPVSADSQPDLADIPGHYQRARGNFWVALATGQVIGSVGLLDIGEGRAALRKMFVAAPWRGGRFGVAQRLLDTLLQWCGGQGISEVLKSVDEAYAAAMTKLPTPRLTRVLLDAVAQHTPPKSGLFRPKPKYAHQGGSNPPVIIIHGNHLEGISNSYKRYLENIFRTTFNLQGTPLRVDFKSGHNPFEARTPKLITPRQTRTAEREAKRRKKTWS